MLKNNGITDPALREALELAGNDPDQSDDERRVEELAKLKKLAYAKVRTEEAARLNIRVGDLDRMVREKQAQSSGQGRKAEVRDVEPWDRPVNGAELLDEMSNAIRAHIILTKEQADTVALYSIYTHGYHVFKVAPRLAVMAPTRECGKSELLMRIERFVRRPLTSENLTAPVVFRLIEDQHPTLFLDELDNLLKEGTSELLGLLNSGYARNGKAHRLVGDQHELREFSTFGPLIFGMIKKARDSFHSFHSRSLPIMLRRATPTEFKTLVSLEDGEPEDIRLLTMGRKAARWVADHVDELKASRPDMRPMVNRPATNWRPIFAVAEIAGGAWPERARVAAAIACKLKQAPIEEEELFGVLKGFSLTTTNDYVESEVLCRTLAEVEGGPWAEYGRTGKPITQTALAALLRPHGISPGQVGPKYARKRGYMWAQFADVFASYAPDTPFSFQEGGSTCPLVHHAANTGKIDPPTCPPAFSAVDMLEEEKPPKNGHGGQVDTLEGGVREVGGIPGHESPPFGQPPADPGDPFETTSTPSSRPPARSPATSPPTPPPAGTTTPKTAQPQGEQPTGRCAQCNGNIDGTERLVEVVGEKIWLHSQCDRFYTGLPKYLTQNINSGRPH